MQFAKLGLVVIDEQHKFGVRQRAALKQAGLDPHYLVMTATPIPRTVTMTLFGDLDVSTLRDSPPGRQKVNTYLADEDERERVVGVLPPASSARGGRATWSRRWSRSRTRSTAASLRRDLRGAGQRRAGGVPPGPDPRPHDAPRRRTRSMDDFRRGEIQVLVCTSVVEVGVDVPNATLMTIESGERFGLAQLHQLRGRISRGSYPGLLLRVRRSAERRGPGAARRRSSPRPTASSLAEIDFELRGPGDLFGTRQHGLPPLRIADLLRDADVLEEARRDAQALVAADPGLAQPEHARCAA